MAKVLFILPPSPTDYDIWRLQPNKICRIPPISLLSIATYLHSKGHQVKIVDSREAIYKHQLHQPQILNAVREFKPDWIGINVLTALFTEAKCIAGTLNSFFPEIPIILGGVHPSVEPELTFEQNEYIDGICIGSGEEIALNICETGKIKDLMAGSNDKNIDKYPPPDFSLVDSKFYTDFTENTLNGHGYRGLGVLTSRSCAYSCKFCSADWSKPLRMHSYEYVLDFVKQLVKYPIDMITFYDDSFANDKNRLEDICSGFIRQQIFYPYSNKRWFAAIRANQVDVEVLTFMKHAGCVGVSMGIETGSDRMLQMINKKTTVEQNRKACEMVNKAGLDLSVTFMLGIPHETEDDMRQTLEFMTSLQCLSKGVGTFRPLPGSPFYNEYLASGVIDKRNVDWANLGNFTVMPDTLYCDVSRDKFEQYYDMANRICYGSSFVQNVVPYRARKMLRKLVGVH